MPVDNGNITVRVYWPEEIKRTLLPALIWFHGGGWTIGSMVSMDSVCRYICHEAGVVVVNVDYRLAPEHKFPTFQSRMPIPHYVGRLRPLTKLGS